MKPAKREVPRWRRKEASPGPVISMSGKNARKLVREMGKAQAAALAHGTALTGQIVPAQLPGTRLAARSGVYRYRLHLVPFEWLLSLITTGLILHRADALPAALVTALCTAAGMLLLTRHLSRFARKTAAALSALTLLWLPLLAAFGWMKPLPALLTGCWLPVVIAWVRRYRWRPEIPEAAAVIQPPGDREIFARVAAKNRWTGALGSCPDLPGGGRQWELVLDGAETHIGQVMSEPRKIAAAWGKPITQAYAEPFADGNESLGLLTILPRNTLETSRQWDGAGIDPETGIAVVGRFPDGQPVHERYFIRRNGVRHTIVAGADGSGKTGLLDLGLCMSATSGFIAPVILDPQEGQALPAWKGHVPYACGAEECLAFLRGLHAGLLDRSRYLAGLRWRTDDGDERTGMGFFDAFMTGLPIVEITLDEAPAFLTDPKLGAEAGRLLADIGKRGRKAGFRLRLAVQVPSLSELGGDAQALRSMLVGGNVFCGRTGDRVSGGMVGISADPHELPKYFPDRSPTVGLGYASGPDNRPGTPMRWMWTEDPYKVARAADIRPLDDRCREAMDAVMGRIGVQAAMQPVPVHIAAVPDDDAPEGRRAADAVLAVLHDAGGELERGVICKRAGVLVTEEWGRPEPFKIRAISDALKALAEDGRISKPRTGFYVLPRASLHSVTTGA